MDLKFTENDIKNYINNSLFNNNTSHTKFLSNLYDYLNKINNFDIIINCSNYDKFYILKLSLEFPPLLYLILKNKVIDINITPFENSSGFYYSNDLLVGNNVSLNTIDYVINNGLDLINDDFNIIKTCIRSRIDYDKIKYLINKCPLILDYYFNYNLMMNDEYDILCLLALHNNINIFNWIEINYPLEFDGLIKLKSKYYGYNYYTVSILHKNYNFFRNAVSKNKKFNKIKKLNLNFYKMLTSL